MICCYLRVSTRKQGESEAGLNAQWDTCLRFAAREGFQISTRFIDAGQGRDSDAAHRPGFCEMLTALSEGDTVVVAARDRLGEGIESALIERDLYQKGVRVLSAQGHNEDSPEAQLVRHVLDAISQYEHSSIRRRITAALQGKKRRGQVYCKRLYGFKAQEGSFVPDENEQRAIALMQKLRRNGESYSGIARLLERMGYKSPGGKPHWRHSAVRAILARV